MTQPSSSQQPTHVRHWVMFFLGVLAFLTYFDRICITKAEKSVTASLGMSSTDMGWVMGAFWFAYAIFELPAGWMGDRFGARITLTRIVLAWSIFTALSGTAVGFFSLFAFRFLFGVGEAGAFPNMARIQSRWLPVASRPRAGGLLWMLARWGGAFSIPIFGEMMRFFDSPGFRDTVSGLPLLSGLAGLDSWRIGFFSAGVLGLVWCLAFYPWFRDHPSEKSSVNAAELELITRGVPAETGGHAMPSHLWKRLLTNKSLIALGLLYLHGSFGWSFFASWMPKYLNEVVYNEATADGKLDATRPTSNEESPAEPEPPKLKTAAEQVSEARRSEWSAALPHLLGGVSCIVGGTLCNIWTARTTNKWLARALFPMVGYVIAAISMFSIQFVTSPTQAVTLLCLAEAAHDFGQGSNWATIVDIGGRYAGVSAGMINTIGNMGNAFQPAIGMMIITKFGWPPVFIVYSCAFLVAATMWLFVDPTKTFYDAKEKG